MCHRCRCRCKWCATVVVVVVVAQYLKLYVSKILIYFKKYLNSNVVEAYLVFESLRKETVIKLKNTENVEQVQKKLSPQAKR